MITSEQRDLVQQIQLLAIAGFEQTGVHICHSVTHGSYGIDSVVQFMGDDTSTLYATTSEFLTEYITLEKQRDELTEWIAEHRKECAA